MDAFEFDNYNLLKPHCSNSRPRFNHCLPKIKNLFRIIEILVILIIFTSASPRLPSAVRITGEYFRRLISVVVSPLFIFMLTNVIVLSLFFKSRHHFPEHSEISLETHLGFCQEFITSGEDHCVHFTRETSFQPEEVVFQDKQTIGEVTKVIRAHTRSDSSELRKVLEADSCRKQLQSLEDEKRWWRVADAGEVDEMSNEEFKRAVESFIAKQIKFHQEEEMDINVLYGFASI